MTSVKTADKAREKLKCRLKLMGELRDTHVQRTFIQEHMPEFPELALVHDFLEQREKRLATIFSRKVHRFGIRKLEKWTVALCRELSDRNGASEQNMLASEAFGAVTKAFQMVVNRRRGIDPKNSETIHRTRVAFKKFRYMLESVSPAFTGLRKSQLRRLGIYQRRMGTLQDLEVLEKCLAEFVQSHPAAANLLKPFCRYLRHRRARVMRSCLKHADQVFDFWLLSASENVDLSLRAA